MKLKGVPVYRFDKEVIGSARVVSEKEADSLKEDNILVAESTNPNFMPAMLKVKGIITERGGLLSHSAIISREFNIPCILGVEKATQLIKDGCRLILKNTGEVIIDEQNR